MSWNGSGSFSRLFSWAADKTAGLDISSSRMDTDTNDITSNGFGNCLTRDGQGSASANLPMNTFRHTGVGNGVARTDYAAVGQVEDGTVNWAVAGGTGDALTVTLSPAVTALVDGQLIFARASAANTLSAPTLNVNALGAHTITRSGGGGLGTDDIPGNLAECIFRYNLANTRFELLNPSIALGVAVGVVTNAGLANTSAWTLKGNNTSGSATPSDFTIDSLTAKSVPTGSDEVLIWDAAASAMKKALLSAIGQANQAPTVQRFISGSSATYTPTSGTVRIKVRMCGGGGGGGAQQTNNGSNGNDTSFGSWTALHGAGGAAAGGAGGGFPGNGVNGTGTLVIRINAGTGQGGGTGTTAVGIPGGNGGSNAFGGTAGGGNVAGTGHNGALNTGAGGGGGGGTSTQSSGGGGSSGEYVEFWMTAAQIGASQTYTIGTGGGGGAAGGQAGGNGADGIIIVEEFYI